MSTCCSVTGKAEDCVDLTDREYKICTLVSNAKGITFGQLKHVANIHQEVLSRILRRLRYYGLIDKTNGAYVSKVKSCCVSQ